MATSFITKLTTINYDPGFTESGETGVNELPVFAPSLNVFQQESIANTGLKGRARNDADIPGAGWCETNFFFNMGGFTEYTASPSNLYEPPYWGAILQSAGMKRTGTSAAASWVYEVVDTIHLSDDSVHTSEHLVALDLSLNIDGQYNTIENGICDVTFSVDVTQGPPRLTVNTFMGNIYEDATSPTTLFYPFPTTDIPADFGPINTGFEPPIEFDSFNATLALSLLTQAGATEIVTGLCLRSWAHTIGNNIVEQRCLTARYKLDQFVVTDQDANTATLVFKATDPGTKGSPGAFNPEEVARNKDMIRLVITHNDGVAKGEIVYESDYYVSAVSKAPDSAGVLEYTLTMKQANVIPVSGTAAQYMKVTCT